MSSMRLRLRSASVVLTYKNITLKRADIDLLRGPYWINDQIIAFYFEYLENDFLTAQDRRKILLVSPQVTQCLKLAPIEEAGSFLEPLKARQKKYIFFPLNDNESDRAGGTHWSLLVFSRPENKFYCFDSLSPFNDSVAERMFEILKTALNLPMASYEKKSSKQQANTYDCGIHVLINVDEILTIILDGGEIGESHILETESANTKRQELLGIIKSLEAKL